MLFDAVYIRVDFPMEWAEQLLWHSEYEKSQRQLLKVGHLSRWVGGLVGLDLGMGEQKADGCNKFCQSCLSMMYVTENTAG